MTPDDALQAKAREIALACVHLPWQVKPSAGACTSCILAALREVDRDATERAARVAENVRGGYTANIREDESEQELVPDVDGPWVLNTDVARAIREGVAR